MSDTAMSYLSVSVLVQIKSTNLTNWASDNSWLTMGAKEYIRKMFMYRI